MKKLLIVLFILISNLVSAGTFKGETEIKNFCENVMGQVIKGDFKAAFNLMKPYIPIAEHEIDSIALQTITQRTQYTARYGKSISYEYIEKNTAGESIVQMVYIEKTTHHALPWFFYFFKTDSGWILNSFTWKDKVQWLFDHN